VEVAEEDPGVVGSLRPVVVLHRGRGHRALARTGCSAAATVRAGAPGVPGVEDVAEAQRMKLGETGVAVVGHEVVGHEVPAV
jgi:hypothetical protein